MYQKQDVKLDGAAPKGQTAAPTIPDPPDVVQQDDVAQETGSPILQPGNGRPEPNAEDDVPLESDSEDPEMARRSQPQYDGIYVEGSAQGLDVTFTIDTGATATLVSSSVFDSIPEATRPRLFRARNPPRAANGEAIKTRGVAYMELCLGPLKLTKKKAIIADIEDEILIGSDVLLFDEEGPANLMMAEEVMTLRNTTIPIQLFKRPRMIRRVRSADHYVVPEMCEAVIDVLVDNPGSTPYDHMLHIEPTPEFLEGHSVAMANCITNAVDNATVKVRIINPFMEPVSIKQDTVVGTVRALHDTDVTTVLLTEDSEETDNNVWVRRLQFALPSNPDIVRRQLVVKVIDSQDTALPTLPEHLKDLFARSSQEMTHEEKLEWAQVLVDRRNAFSENEYDLGYTHLTEHVILTGDAKPVKQPPRRLPIAYEGEDRRAIDKLLKQGSIRPSTSPWASPIVLVRKKDGSVRPCVDYRRVNAVTIKDAFPLPRAQDCIDALAGSTLFSTLDITSAYNQVPLREEDIPKTAFTTRCGLYEYVTMPFGLCNATATFQRLMEMILAGLQWNICIIFVDDVIVHGRNFREKIDRLKIILLKIEEAGLKLKPSKCHLFRTSVIFLGHIVSAEGVLPDPANIEKVQNLAVPSNCTDVRKVLGLMNYYRRFVQSYSDKARPIIQLTRKDETFIWSDQCQAAFELLKGALTSPPVMAYPITDGKFILDTDASAFGIGAVLSQIQEGKERVIAYGSKALSRAEKNWCVTDRELFAVKHFTDHYRHYLLGRQFVVRTDHQALKWLFSLKEPKSRIARWIESLSAFHFTVEYRPGKQHGNADAMSRCLDPRHCECPEPNTPLKCGPCGKCTKRTQDMEGDDEVLRRTYSAKSPQLSRVFANLTQPFCTIVLWLMAMCSYIQPSPQPGTGIPKSSDKKGPDMSHKNRSCKLPQIKAVPGTLVVRRVLSTIRQTWKSLGRGSKWLSAGHVRRLTRSTSHVGWAMPYSMKTLRTKQMTDLDIGPILKWVESGQRPSSREVAITSPAVRHLLCNWVNLEVRDGVLFRKYYKKDATGTHAQMVVPQSMRTEVLTQMHNCLLSGHLGRKKTQEKLLQRFYWFGVRSDVANWVRKCDACGAIKTPSQHPRAPMGSLAVGGTLDRLATDILGPLPETPRGNRYILVVTDHFTKWVEIFAVPDQTAITCADRILNDVIARYGCPINLHSDQGRNYESIIFQELCRLLEIRKTRTSPGNPRCNGQSERFNRTLVRMIKAYLKGEQREWDRHLGCLAAAYRATPHESTGVTPNLLMLGREVRLPAEVMFGSGTTHIGEEVATYGDYVDKLKLRMQHAHEVARDHLKVAAKRSKLHYDTKAQVNKYTTGDLVWYQTDISQLHITPKLRVPYEGPHLVLRKLNDLDYLIQFDAAGKKRVVHHNRLKPYEGNQTIRWQRAALAKDQRNASIFQ
jgi:hypothetical protein